MPEMRASERECGFGVLAQRQNDRRGTMDGETGASWGPEDGTELTG